MKIKYLIDEDFINYKKPSMFIATSYCSFKCDKECGKPICQNSKLANASNIEISNEEIIKRFNDNPITEAIVFGGLEPFDDFMNLLSFITEFRCTNEEDIVIYTGYYPEEISTYLKCLKTIKGNVIIKFGRFVPDKSSYYNELLGVILASDNQYVMKLEDCDI